MARVSVSLEAFSNGELPPVCAKTGEPADRLLPVLATYTPRWTWLLLPFGGFWAFLIARGFTAEETMGLVPFSRAGLVRWRLRGRRRLSAEVLGAVLLLIVLYLVAWPYALVGGYVLVAVLFGFGWVSVGFRRASGVGAQFDPDAKVVLLWGVHDRFKQAISNSQRPDPNVRYWQTQ